MKYLRLAAAPTAERPAMFDRFAAILREETARTDASLAAPSATR